MFDSEYQFYICVLSALHFKISTINTAQFWASHGLNSTEFDTLRIHYFNNINSYIQMNSFPSSSNTVHTPNDNKPITPPLPTSPIPCRQYPTGRYYANWTKAQLKSTPQRLMKLLTALPFADREDRHMRYRGNPISRTKCVLIQSNRAVPIESMQRIPIYLFPGFQYAQVLLEYKLIELFPIIRNMQQTILNTFKHETNHVIVTLYEDGKDNIGWHNDKPATIDPDTPIYIWSVGEERPLLFRTNGSTTEACRIPMESGSLFVLDQTSNMNYQHCIAATVLPCKPRISVIFRRIINLVPVEEIKKKVATGSRKRASTKSDTEFESTSTEGSIHANKKYKLIISTDAV